MGGFEVDVLARQAAAYREAWTYVEAVALLPGASDASVLDQRADLLPRPEVYVGDDGWQHFLDGYPWPADQAYRVMMCESGGNPNAVNPSGSYGLFQIQAYWHEEKIMEHAGTRDYGALLDPAVNMAVAYDLYADYGSWYHWRFSASCHGLWP